MTQGQQEVATLPHDLEVTLRYGSLEKKVTGSPEQVAQEMFVFLNSIIPQLELASRLTLSIDISTLAKACEGILAVTPEGVVVTVPVEMLADRELLLLHLAKSRIAHLLENLRKT